MTASNRGLNDQSLGMMGQSAVVCLLMLVTTIPLLAQGGATGTIVGVVMDPTGAVVADADVTVTNVATGVDKATKSNAAGDYTVPYLTPGTYRVTVKASGFQTSTADKIQLAVAQTARVNMEMKPGEATSNVEVSATSIALETDTAEISQLVTQNQVQNLPLNGRNFLNLLFIGAGAVQTNGEQGQMRQGEGNAISINGGRPTSNNYTLDGLVNTDTSLNTPAVVLSQDAIQEFKVQSETYTAELGFSANQVNIISKSGSNNLHGNIFEFFRNDALDAKAPFQSQIPKLRQNQFGFVVGGPVYIPKLYDGRNKTFFLVNYEGWRIYTGTNDYFYVPPPSWLTGDFSQSGLKTMAQGCVPGPGQLCMPVDPTTGQPFPGNIIPAGRFSRMAQVMNKLIPAPNCFSVVGCNGNFLLNTNLSNTVNQQTYKLDQNIGKWGSFAFRYTQANYSNQNINGADTVPFGVGIFSENTESWAVNYTMNIGTKVNNFRFGYLEPQVIQGGNPAPASDVQALGLTGTFQNLPPYARLYPGVSFQGFPNTVHGSQVNDVTVSDIPMWEFADSFTMTKGRHTIGFGFDFRTWLQKRNLSSDFLGNITYNNDTILNNNGGCATVVCGTGNSVADYLLGYYNNASTFQPSPFSEQGVAGNLNKYQFNYFAPYVQDTWKVTPSLTVNAGLRWDYRTTPYEEHNKMFWFHLNNPNGGLCMANKNLETTVAPPGNGFYSYCGRNNPNSASLKPFAPRVGIAYSFPDGKTVIRAGYGVYFDSFETREIDDSGDIYPYVVRASPNATTDPTLPKTTDGLFPIVTQHVVSPATDGSQFFAVIISENWQNPYVQQWSLSLQRQLSTYTTLEFSYVGNKGTHLLDRVNIGQPLAPSNPAFCQANPSLGDCPASVRRPYANITSSLGFLDSRYVGWSNYNAGNIKLERRAPNLAFVAVYTWSKSLDDKSAAAGVGATNAFAGHMDEHNPRLDYGRSDFDVGQRFVASFVYQLPFGHGQKFASGVNRATDTLIGGWQFTGIATFQQGFPFSILANDQFGLLVTFTQRANQSCDPNSGPTNLNHYFNTSCFTQPLAGQFGSSGRNILRQPGIANWDMGLAKNFGITEQVKFQFRIEAFNTFNHAQYGLDPSTTTGIQSSVDNNPNDPLFGKVVAARPGRVLQLGAKITF
jgi:hypothetical protein